MRTICVYICTRYLNIQNNTRHVHIDWKELCRKFLHYFANNHTNYIPFNANIMITKRRCTALLSYVVSALRHITFNVTL